MKNKLNRCRYTLTAVLLLSGLLLTGCDSLLPDGQTTVESTETDYPSDQPEETTEAALPEPVPPTVIEGFSEDSLRLFSAEQGALSVSEDGALVLNAEWNDGDPNRSYLIFDPVSVMKAADSEAKAAYLSYLAGDTTLQEFLDAYSADMPYIPLCGWGGVAAYDRRLTVVTPTGYNPYCGIAAWG